jgi:two-component system, NarL family, response regulator DevR
MTVPARPVLRIMVVDDSELVRRGIKSVLQEISAPSLRVISEADSVASAVAECLRTKPDVMLLDVRLPDGSGFEVCRQISAKLPATRIIILTAHSSDNLVYEAVTAGAHGYLLKEIDPAALIHAIEDVASGRSILDPDATSRVLRLLRGTTSQTEADVDLSVLSHQERRVLALVADGLTNKQVGEQLGLSENTVKNYLVNVFDKLQVKRRAHAAAIYTQQVKGS